VNQDNRIAIRLPAGTHDVKLGYRSPGFVSGFIIGLVTLLACVFLVRRERREEAGEVTG
jgi:uncharacterized membrane protein YfhO